VALLLAGASVLAVLAFINHSAHSMRVGEIIERIAAETRRQIEKNCPEPAEPGATPPALPRMPSGPGLVVRSGHDGWVQHIDVQAILALLPPNGLARLETSAGAFAAAGAPLCTIGASEYLRGVSTPSGGRSGWAASAACCRTSPSAFAS
jgi:uncharacterized membrane protein